jgi:hypothetical protein
MEIKLNSILTTVVLVVLIFFFIVDKNGTYLNGSELQVYLLLAVTLVALVINSRFNNEFLEILNVVFVIFYICRIPFIFSADLTSVVIARGVDISHIHWYLFVLAFQYLSLIICILIVNPRISRWHLDNRISEFIFSRILVFSFIIIFANIILTAFWFDLNNALLSNIPAILKTIFTIKSAIVVILLSSFMVEKKILLKYKYLVVFCLLLGIGCITYQGGKSIVLLVILLTYLVMVVMYGPMVFRLRGLIILAVSTLGAFIMFLFGSVVRTHQIRGYSEGGFIFQLWNQVINKSDMLDWVHSISYRIGYFDFYIQVVSNPVFKPYVSFTYYFKAILDKLTPGFDIFNTPFMSRMLYSAYFNSSNEYYLANSTIMNSNLVTVFGESYLLFGFFSFCLFLPLLFLFKYTLTSVRTSSRLSDALFYLYLVYLFYWWLTGMGLDMFVTTMVYEGIFIFFTIGLIWFWSKRESLNTSD